MIVEYGPQIGKGGDGRYRVRIGGRFVGVVCDSEAECAAQARRLSGGWRVVRTVFVEPFHSGGVITRAAETFPPLSDAPSLSGAGNEAPEDIEDIFGLDYPEDNADHDGEWCTGCGYPAPCDTCEDEPSEA